MDAQPGAGLSDYYKLMAEIGGRTVATDPSIKCIDLDFRGGKGQQGSCTIVLKNNIPVELQWYVWDLDDDWMFEQVECKLQAKIKVGRMYGGNGHMSAAIESFTPYEKA